MNLRVFFPKFAIWPSTPRLRLGTKEYMRQSIHRPWCQIKEVLISILTKCYDVRTSRSKREVEFIFLFSLLYRRAEPFENTELMTAFMKRKSPWMPFLATPNTVVLTVIWVGGFYIPPSSCWFSLNNSQAFSKFLSQTFVPNLVSLPCPSLRILGKIQTGVFTISGLS